MALGTAAITGAVTLTVLLTPSSPQPSPATGESTAISAIASSPGNQTLAIRAGKVDWLALDPTRWTRCALPSHFVPPLAGSMHPTVVAVTNEGVGLVGMSNGVVLAAAPGARHAAAVVADYMPGRVVALAGMGSIGHLQLLVSTATGTYSVGLKGPLAVWWPHREATAVAAPPNSQGAWAALVAGRLAWAATPERALPGGGVSWSCPSFTFVGGPQPKPSTGWCGMPGPSARWTVASSADLGRNALLAESPDGIVAVATHRGAVLTGDPGEGLSSELHTVATGPLGPAATPIGLVTTYSPSGVGNVLALVAAGTPLLVDGWSGWETAGGPARVRLAAGVGSDVVEVQPSGSVRVVNLYQPGVAYAPPQRSVPSWVEPALGLAGLMVLLVLAGCAAWRLPWRPWRVAVFTVAGVVLVGFGGVAVGRFVAPMADHYTRSQVQQAWVNGTYVGSWGNWLVTPSQCAILTGALGWKGPVPSTLTTTVAPDGPGQAVPTCDLEARHSQAQNVAAMGQPLNRQLSQNAISYFLFLNLGTTAPRAVQTASQSACSRLRGACEPSGANGHFLAYYAVRLVFPPKDYGLWQKVIGGSS